MESQFSKLILGTVQLGMPYGAGRWANELMPEATAFSILDAAWDSGITTLDTSSHYGVAEERIAKFMRLNPSKNFDLISKVKSQNTVSTQKLSCFDDWRRTSPLSKVESKTLFPSCFTMKMTSIANLLWRQYSNSKHVGFSRLGGYQFIQRRLL